MLGGVCVSPYTLAPKTRRPCGFGERYVWTDHFEHLGGRYSPVYRDLNVVRNMTDLHEVVERLDSLQATTVFVFYNPPSARASSDSDDDSD